MHVLCGHLYPDYLNIYADRGNIAVLERRAGWRGIDFEIVPIGMAGAIPADVDLLYVGGGQDREQALIAADLASRGAELSAAIASGTALLAVCGGYQLLGRYYRDRSGRELPGAGVLPLWTEAGDRRMIGDILLDCDLPGAGRRTLAGFENHGGRTYLEPGAEALGRVVAGFGNNGEDGLEGCRYEGAIGTYLHGPLLPRNPWLADWLIARALAHRLGRPPELEPLPDELERRAHEVAAGRARGRGGRYS
jgi:lipid II isoglutaminyl synthase (glutamine-hydrolysing)